MTLPAAQQEETTEPPVAMRQGGPGVEVTGETGVRTGRRCDCTCPEEACISRKMRTSEQKTVKFSLQNY